MTHSRPSPAKNHQERRADMNRVSIHRFISFVLVLIVAFSVTGCKSGKSGKASEDPTFIEKTVEEIAVNYGTYGAEAKDRIKQLLKELSATDQSTGTRWERIMNLWMSPELGQPLHYDVLPDGLPDTDELAIIVLGFQLNPDGTMKEELIERLTVAQASAEKYPNA